ncbi:MAG TPA: ATP phosphoribosyltransferase regulatory subunit [Thermohalobaculum sp.]|nr:ATP phosphoribosyltransferase regulatory subunit [Thermohalobaculum sp.]
MIAAASDGALEALLGRLDARFAAAGSAAVAARHLFPAETLLDLYGEDLRTRAFLFPGGGTGEELCLRPDFTVPVALAHGAGGWDRQAAYRYRGPVFRRQAGGSARPVEYLQAGIESLGRPDGAAAEAEVFATLLAALADACPAPVTVATGDLGIAFALLDALPLAPRRRRALKRHFWRPARFHALIAEFAAPPRAPSPRRAALLEAAGVPDPEAAVAALAEEAGEVLGLRETAEIAARASELAVAAGEPPMDPAHGRLIEAALAVSGPAPQALAELDRLLAGTGPAVAAALERFADRLAALEMAGIATAELPFDAAFGRKLEYYDGFVFEVAAAGRPELPPLAGGGRYDSMTVRLGAAPPVPAVGGMIRPEAALAAGERG